ncbi:hypothetical protein BDY19DRAFT_915537 [Irpex rosettiformis]|uniref:Uncharacterized protein n=1 Tax=Irpex rosettiformis TaxID=378272 RepID=A0ACB8UKW2_9APHY|nr:hypothetical protein BDY19DRAFT_915537 [Irpex rosettiformis]
MLRCVLPGNVRTPIARAMGLQARSIASSLRLLQASDATVHFAEDIINHVSAKPVSPPTNGKHLNDPDNGTMSANIWNISRNFSTIWQALVKRDFPTLWQAWEALDSADLEHWDPSRYDRLSEEIASVLLENFVSGKLDGYILVLEDIVLVAASHGFSRGLLAVMHTYLHSQDLDSVFRLYQRFLDAMKCTDKQAEESTETMDVDSEDEIFTGASTRFRVTDEVSKYSRRTEDKLHAEMLMYAVAASAMGHDFSRAIHFVLNAGHYLTGGQVHAFMTHLGSEFPSAVSIQGFLRRAVTASLISRPRGLVAYIIDITNRHSTIALRQLYDDVVQGLTSDDPWLTLHPENVSSQTPLVVSPHIWSLLLTGFMRNGKLDWAEEMWDTMLALGVAPASETWRSLIGGYGFLKMPDQVTHAWDAMIQQGLKPDIKTHRTMLGALIRCKREEEARTHIETFQKLVDGGRLSGTESEILSFFNAAISAYLTYRKIERALSVLDRLETVGPTPNNRTIEPFLAYYSRRSQYKAFAGILEKIEKYKLVPSDYTYTTILTAMLPVRDDAVSVVFNFMRQYGKTPNVAMYTVIIDALMEEQTTSAFRTALKLLQQMESSKNAQPTHVTFTCILSGILRGNWLDRETAQQYISLIAHKMKKRRLMFSIVSYHIFIKAGLENQEPEGLETAMQYYREMRRRRMTPVTDTWYLLLTGLVRRRAWEMADAVVEDLQKSKVPYGQALAKFAIIICLSYFNGVCLQA